MALVHHLFYLSMQRLFFLIFSLILIISYSNVYAQWIDERIPLEFDKQIHGISHHQCSIDAILSDPESIKSLQVFQELRKNQPEGALVKSTLSSAQVGDTRNFRVRNLTNNQWRTVSFKLQARNDRLLIWVEESEIAPDRVNDEVVSNLFTAMTLSTPSLSLNPNLGIMEINETVFGNPPNIDGSNTLNILITDVIDGWEPGRSTVAGFFDPVDLNPNNSNSNRADIIYLNSRPIIHLDGNVNTTRAIPVAAHEYQHLIHANYGNLTIFQNEGQSEWAELLNGFQGRAPQYFSNPTEINQFLYRWRSNTQEVLIDYQRASMLHSYIAQRAGVSNTGQITRATSSFNAAYNQVLSQAGLQLSEVLKDFHIANFVNNQNLADGRFGYQDIRRRGNRVNFATFTYFPGQTSGNETRTLRFGGADYIEWIGASDLIVNTSGSGDVRFAFILYPLDIQQQPEVIFANSGTSTFTGEYERVVMVASVTSLSTGTETNPPDFTYSYDSQWNTLPVFIQSLTYAGAPAFFAELPGTPGISAREGIKEYAKRFSPQFDSRINEVQFFINGRDSSLIGNDNLRIILAQAQFNNPNFVPSVRLDSLEISISELNRGENRISLEGQNWSLQSGSHYFIIFRVTTNTSRIEFLLDAGSTNTNNPNYFPPRTYAYLAPPTRPVPGWYSYQSNNNLLISLRLTGLYDGPITAPAITRQPIGGVAAIESSFTFSVGASGVPRPFFQWYKDGQPIYGADTDTFVIESMTEADAGVYTVLVSNPGGFIFSDPVTLETRFEDFALEGNGPNPFSTETTIRFVTPENLNITLDVFDISGRLVSRLLDNQAKAAGRHAVIFSSFDTAPLASGVYIYRIRGVSPQNTYKATGKMLLIK